MCCSPDHALFKLLTARSVASFRGKQEKDESENKSMYKILQFTVLEYAFVGLFLHG